MRKPVTITITATVPNSEISIIKDFRTMFGLALREAKQIVMDKKPLDIYLDELPIENLRYLMFDGRRFVIEEWETPEERIRFRVMWHRAQEQKLLRELAELYEIAV